jgi:hypothetical protein
MKGINRTASIIKVRSIGCAEEKATANGFWSRAFGAEKYLCLEASGEYALALKHAVDRDHFRDPHIL